MGAGGNEARNRRPYGMRVEARVEHRQHAAVGFRPNEPPEALKQGQGRERHLVLLKRVAAARVDRGNPRRDQRIGRERRTAADRR